MDLDDEPRRPESALDEAIKEPLDDLSLAELRKRIALLEAEIRRVEVEITQKDAGKAAAEAFFGVANGLETFGKLPFLRISFNLKSILMAAS